MIRGNYYYSKIVNGNFEDYEQKVTNLLAEEGFGIISEIDVSSTMKKKLDVDFRKYKILGACNPNFAYRALSYEDKIGTLLPCNFIIQELEPNKIEIAAVNPKISMQAVENDNLFAIANEVDLLLKDVIEKI